jgi:NADH-quinone oxidoreductase subunit G
MPTLEIDGQKVTVEDGANLIQAAESAGIEIPHYCYHPGLSIAGNCRMCLVEIEKMPKLQIACNTRASEGMVVRTQVDRVKKAREAVLEFLLINHPIDCPICDQAGECKLQDYYMDYDRQPSRRPLEEKVHKGKALEIGSHVMLDQERCILCTRCVRFLDEVTHTGELGIFNRGDHSDIDLFPGQRLENPYSANVVDICPVGALTAKDFRFRARVWYLEHTPSVCPTCATGCNIDIHHRRGQTYRFRPRHNGDVNHYWLCDEGRFSFPLYQSEHRVLNPFLRRNEQLVPASWNEVTAEVTQRLSDIRAAKSGAIVGVVSAKATNEEAHLFARLLNQGLGGTTYGLSWSAPDATHDDFLRDADKNPNTRGLRALGLQVDGIEELAKRIEAGEVKALLLWRADLGPLLGSERLQALADKLDYIVVADSDGHASAGLADAVLPLASFAEMDGTFTNRSGRVQRIREAYPPPGGAVAGWKLLAELGTALAHFNAYASAAAVFDDVAAALKPFAGLDYKVVGVAGANLAQA